MDYLDGLSVSGDFKTNTLKTKNVKEHFVPNGVESFDIDVTNSVKHFVILDDFFGETLTLNIIGNESDSLMNVLNVGHEEFDTEKNNIVVNWGSNIPFNTINTNQKKTQSFIYTTDDDGVYQYFNQNTEKNYESVTVNAITDGIETIVDMSNAKDIFLTSSVDSPIFIFESARVDYVYNVWCDIYSENAFWFFDNLIVGDNDPLFKSLTLSVGRSLLRVVADPSGNLYLVGNSAKTKFLETSTQTDNSSS